MKKETFLLILKIAFILIIIAYLIRIAKEIL
jgi:hypothetical protein